MHPRSCRAMAEQARSMYDVAAMTVMAPHAVDGLKMVRELVQVARSAQLERPVHMHVHHKS